MGLRDFLVQGVGRLIPDKLYLQIKFFYHFKRFADLKHPKTFNEKLQWLKLYDQNPRYTMLVDKYEAKIQMAEIIGEKHIIETYGVWDRFEDIDFDSLPDRFVLKTTHDCGGVVICKDKAMFDKEKAKVFLEKHLKKDYYLTGREWPYKNVKPRIIAERFLEEASGVEAIDYKVMCFNGRPKLIQLHLGRFTEHTQDFYDANWVKQDMELGLPKSNIDTPKPEYLEEMLELSEKLARGISQVRCDWYCIGGTLYIGEMTFYEDSGFGKFNPVEYDYKLGEWIDLPHREDK